jgi:hypothetical protein
MSKRNLKKVAVNEAIQASRKFRERKVFVNKKENGEYKTSLNQTPESVAVYRNGSEISL